MHEPHCFLPHAERKPAIGWRCRLSAFRFQSPTCGCVIAHRCIPSEPSSCCSIGVPTGGCILPVVVLVVVSLIAWLLRPEGVAYPQFSQDVACPGARSATRDRR